jgi:nucleolar MIF4G domain-containing protein 1
VDAYERLMKLTLTEVQQREIARVLLQCSGNVSICYKMLIYTNTIVLVLLTHPLYQYCI